MYIKHVIFQSTRPSRASTGRSYIQIPSPGISIHKALAGLDITLHIFLSSSSPFQSTRPSRASTLHFIFSFPALRHFNPQGPRGPRPNPELHGHLTFTISIHKALAGLDLQLLFPLAGQSLFQSTRPSRASTMATRLVQVGLAISIHKALAGLDMQLLSVYPLTWRFQSTRPSRASTILIHKTDIWFRISIHKALAGLDATL